VRHVTLILGAVALLFVLAACGGGADPQPVPAVEPALPQASALSVDMHDIYFEAENTNIEQPPIWTVNRGAEVNVELINLGNLEHNWAVVEMGREVPIPYTGGEDQDDLFYFAADVVPPGQTQNYTFTAPDLAGSYLVICTVPGHYPVMQGRLEVE
jgi:uncharacterized cupredoxin-like copper-binding protein